MTSDRIHFLAGACSLQLIHPACPVRVQGCVDLIAACTARDPAQRPSAAQVVQRLAEASIV